ncbi:MAG: MFS transporter [Clostridiales bacterium]
MQNYKNLLRHTFYGNFDTGVLLIFLSFFIWDESKTMFAVAIAFMIPVFINTIIDYFFSELSDRGNRIRLIVIGNVGSAFFLSLYGLSTSIYMLYGLIFIKSLFAKIYNTSLSPFIREAIKEEDYKSFIAKLNVKGSVGAAVGGFTLMMVYLYTKNLSLIFLISGSIELFSTLFLVRLKLVQYNLKKKKEDEEDIKWFKNITIIYTIKAFGIALIMNRIIISLHDIHIISIEYVGLIFFVTYGVSKIIAAQIYDWFSKVKIQQMLIFSFVVQAIALLLFSIISELYFIIGVLFIYELVDNITFIYTSDRINKSLFTSIGKKLSKFRIIIAFGSIAGQLIIGQIWDRVGVSETFYFTSLILMVLVVIIIIRKDELKITSDKN